MTVSTATGSEELVVELAGGGNRWGGHRARRILVNVALYVVAMALALALASVLIVIATDAAPFDVFHAMYEGSLSRPSAIGLTLDRAMPILIVALGGIIATRAAMFNIGLEGQLMVGGLMGAVVALKLGLPPSAALPLTIVASAVGGGLWAGIASLLRFWRGVDVVISTLLLNFVAVEVLSFALNKSWLLQETTSNVQKLPQSDRLEPAYQITRIGTPPDFSVSTGIFLAVILAGLVAFALARTRWGFRLKMLGMNPNAARAAGVSLVAVGGSALVISGAFAGLAGGVIFAGTAFRIQPGFSANIGNDGLLVALIARRNVAATVPVAFFFGAMRAGGGFLAATGVPRYLVDVVQPLLVLAALLPPAVLFVWDRRQALRTARHEAEAHDRPTPIGAAA
jgi:simple sugar transport system permease protein